MKWELPQKVENFKKEVAEMKELEISLNRRLKWYIMERNTWFFLTAESKYQKPISMKSEILSHPPKKIPFYVRKFDIDPESVNDKQNSSYEK